MHGKYKPDGVTGIDMIKQVKKMNEAQKELEEAMLEARVVQMYNPKK